MVRVLLVAAGLAAFAPLAAAQEPAWQRVETTDKLDDSKSVGVYRIAESTEHRPHLRPANNLIRARLALVCDGSGPQVNISVLNTLIAGHRHSISYRVDARQPVKELRWSESDDHSGIALIGKKRIASFVSQLMGGRSLLVRINDGNFGETEAVFALDGIKEAIQPVWKACRL